jgi:hypothetical protein
VHKENSIKALRRYNAFRSPRVRTLSMANATTRRPSPEFLSLGTLFFKIRFPLLGAMWILHRISGLPVLFDNLVARASAG